MKFNKIIMAAMTALGLLATGQWATQAAPTSIPVTMYPLTNTLYGTTNALVYTNGSELIGTGAVYTVTSQPFQIWRGRGFALNAAIQGTNANTGTLGYSFRFASVHTTNWSTGSGLVTNWSTANNLTVNVPATGTTEQFWWTNIQPTVVDNVQLGQLYQITNNSLNGINYDPTNNFVSVYP